MNKISTQLCAGIFALASTLHAAEKLPDFLDKVQLHNFAGAEPTQDGKGALLYRMPKAVREQMTEKNKGGSTGAEQMLYARHSEIRFVLNPGAKREDVKIHLQATKGGKLLFFQGDVACGEGAIKAGGQADPVVFPSVDATPEDPKATRRFAGNVFRIVLSGGALTLTGIEGDIRPPKADELPRLTMMSYGTSITQGHAASRADLAWNALTAQALGYDLVNLGCSGTAYCEPAVADYLAAQTWDLCVLELSVNMVGRGFSTEEFRKRVTYMVDTLAKSHPKAPIVCISIFPYFADKKAKSPVAGRVREYRAALEEICKTTSHKNVYFFSGPDLLSFDGLSPDNIHPSDKGMNEIASKLAPHIRELLEKRK